MNDESNSPTRLLIGGRFDEFVPVSVIERGEGTLLLQVEFEEGHRNAAGMVHGGFQMAALDVTLAGAAAASPSSSDRLYGITLSMTTNFLRPAPAGRLYCWGEVTGGGKSTKFVDGRLLSKPPSDPGALVYATATGTMRVIVLKDEQ